MDNKILFCASTASHILNFHQPYLNYYKEQGMEVHVAVSGTLALSSIDKAFDFNFEKNLNPIKTLQTICKLTSLIREQQYKLISTHTTLAGGMCRLALRLSGVKSTKLVHTCHGYLFDDDKSLKSSIYLFCEKALSKVTHALITMNQQDYEIAQKYKLSKKIYFSYGMGIDAKKYNYCSEETLNIQRQKWKISDENTIFLCVGEFSKRKNQQLLIQAFARLYKNNCNIRLLFAGTGKTLNQCEQAAQTLGVAESVLFLGHMKEMDILYAVSDAVISTSRYEGLPFNIMEALYYGKSVVASDIKGHRDLLLGKERCYLSKCGDVEALVSAMSHFLSLEESDCDQLKLDARYLLPQAIDHITGIYNELINS